MRGKNTLTGWLLGVLLVMWLAMPAARAQADATTARETWQRGYNLYQEAVQAENDGDYAKALELFTETAKIYASVRRLHPNWNSFMVDYRLRECVAKVQELKPKAEAARAALPPTQVQEAGGQLQDRVVLAERRLAELRDELQQAHQNLDRAREEAAKGSAALDQVERLLLENRRLRQDKEALEGRVGELSTQLRKTDEEERLRAALLEARQQAELAKTRQEEYLEARRRLERQVEDLNNRLRTLSLERLQLLEARQNADQARAAQDAALADALKRLDDQQTRLGNMDVSLHESRQTVARQEQTIGGLNAALAALREQTGDADDVRQQLIVARAEMETSRRDLERSRTLLGESQRESGRMRGELDALQQANIELRARLDELGKVTADTQALKQRAEDAEDTARAQTRKYDALRTEHEALTRTSQALAEDLKRRQTELEESRTLAADLTTTRQELRTRIAALETQREQQAEAIKGVENRLREAAAAADAAREEARQRQEALTQARTVMENQDADLRRATGDLRRLREELAQSRDETQRAREDLTAARGERDALQTRLDAALAAGEQATAAAEAARAETRTFREELAAVRAALAAQPETPAVTVPVPETDAEPARRLVTLEAELAAAQTARQQFEERLAAVQQDAVEARDQRRQLEERLTTAQREAAEARDQRRQLEGRLAAADGEKRQIETTLAASNRQLEERQGELAGLRTQLEESRREHTALQVRVAELERQLAIPAVPAVAAPETPATAPTPQAAPGEDRLAALRDELVRLTQQAELDRDTILVLSDKLERADAELALLRGEAPRQAEPDQQALAEERRRELQLLLHRASVAENQGSRETARGLYEKILELDPNNYHALVRSGNMLTDAGRFVDAQQRLMKAFYQNPDDRDVLLPLGFILVRREQADMAVSMLSRAVALYPDDAVFHRYLGVAATMLGWHDVAEVQLRRGWRLEPGNPENAFNLAMYYANLNPPRKNEARHFYRLARQLGHDGDPGLDRIIAYWGQEEK